MIGQSYMVLDTETTGLPDTDKKRNQSWSRVWPVSIAAMLIDEEGAPVDEWSCVCSLPEGVVCDPGAERIHGITSERIEADGVTHSSALERLIDFSSRSLYVVGHNLWAFDRMVLRHYCAAWHRPIHDSKLVWNAWTHGLRITHLDNGFGYGVLAGTDFKALSSLDHVAQTLGVDHQRKPGANHDALDDCRITHLVWEEMIERGIVSAVLGQR